MPANQTTARILNQKDIVSSLMVHGDQSRAALAKRLGLSKPAIAENVEGLIRLGLVREIGEGAANRRGGRRPRILAFNRAFRYLIAVDLTLSTPHLVVGDLTGAILSKEAIQGLEHITDDDDQKGQRVIAAIEGILSGIGATAGQLGAIAIATPALTGKGTEVTRTNLPYRQWSGYRLDLILAKIFGVPTTTANSVCSAAFGEAFAGCGTHYQKILYVHVGKYLGAGIVLDGQLYVGANRDAGDIGSTVTPAYLNRGEILEDVVCIGGLLRQIRLDIQNGVAPRHMDQLYQQPGGLGFEHVLRLYGQRDEYILEKIRALGTELGYALSNASSLLDLDLIVLGGDYDPFFEDMRSEIQSIVRRYVSYAPVILFSQLGEDAALTGALLKAREVLFESMQL